MSDQHDGLARLRATNPIDTGDVDGPDSARAQLIFNKVTTTESGIFSRQSLRLAIILAALLVLTTAAAIVLTRPIQIATAISCYRSVDLNADIAVAASGTDATAAACESAWSDAVLVNEDFGPPGFVPPLTACVKENGALAVFPTDDGSTCDRLGLARPDPSSQGHADLIRRVEADLVDYFSSDSCISMDDAAQKVRRVLDESGLASWQMTTQPTTPERRCASFSLDETTETVYLVPID